MAAGRMPGPDAGQVAPEMARPFAVARAAAGADVTVEASAAERAALARRMGVVAIHALSCRFALGRLAGAAIAAKGFLRARVRQVCVVSLEEFDAEVTEDFSVRFVPAGTESEEIDPDADDEIGYAGGMLDLGEAASEQLALALEPFPRKPGIAFEEPPSAEQRGAFAALSQLRPARSAEQEPTDDRGLTTED